VIDQGTYADVFAPTHVLPRRPKLGFIGVGWIGAHRLETVARDEVAEIVGVADTRAEAARRALLRVRANAPMARLSTLDRLFEAELDGIVIATPNDVHAEQAVGALHRGIAVFCQKPLARTQGETSAIVTAARRNDRLLDVDFCYRHVAGVSEMTRLVSSGDLGTIYAADLVFHNAYGPDKPWFNDPRQAGGGCVMDLGIHLIDLLLWVLDYPSVKSVTSRLYSRGRLLPQPVTDLEDFAIADIELGTGATARLACSWRMSTGCDAVIEASFYGSRGSVRLRNCGGSFYDFVAEHCEGTQRRILAAPPDDWGGRAICSWARRLAASSRFDESADRLVDVSALIDAIYGR
jgi:predicted dehydrogenase